MANVSEWRPYDVDFYLILVPYCFFCGSTLLTVSSIFWLLPVYLHVHRVNRSRDEETAVYPILRHFSFLVNVMYMNSVWIAAVSLGFSCFCLLNKKWISFLEEHEDSFIALISILFIAIAECNIVTQVQTVLMSLLAVQRFALFFFAASKPYVNLSHRTSSRVVYIVYLIMTIRQCVESVNLVYLGNEEMLFYNSSLAFYVWFHVFFVSSLFLYIPILASIRKQKHLQSAIRNKPEKYIIYQSVSVILIKILFLPGIALVVGYNLDVLLVLSTLIDVISSPFVIQVSYLLSNKRNLDASLKSILCWRIDDTLQISPVPAIVYSMSSAESGVTRSQ